MSRHPAPSELWGLLPLRVVSGLFRLGGALSLALMLAFPFYKHRAEGLLPLIASAIGAGFFLRITDKKRWSRTQAALTRVPERTFLLLILGIPALLQAALLLGLCPQPKFDALFVIQEAERLARTGQMSALTYYAPAQIAYYALLFKLLGASPLVAQLGQIPLGIGMIAALYGLARRALPPTPARAAALALAFYPSMILYVLVTPYYFYLYTFLILLMVGAWLAVAQNKGQTGAAFLGGLAAGLGALTKAVLLVAPLQAMAFWFLSARSFFQRKLWAAWLLFIAGMTLIVAPWAWRNRQVFGETILVCTSGPLVLWSANNLESDGLYSPLPDQRRIETPQDMLRHMRDCRDQAQAFILAHPGHFLRLAARKFLHTWGTETSYVEWINHKGQSIPSLDPALRFLAQTGWGMLVMLWAFVGLRALAKHQPTHPIELATAILVLTKWVVYSFYEGGARHHLPAVPLLILYVASGLFATPREDSSSWAMA